MHFYLLYLNIDYNQFYQILHLILLLYFPFDNLLLLLYFPNVILDMFLRHDSLLCMDYCLCNGFLLDMILMVLLYRMYMLLFHLFYLSFPLCKILILCYVEVLLLLLSFLSRILMEDFLCLEIRKVDLLLLLFSLGGMINFQSNALLLIRFLFRLCLLDQKILCSICSLNLRLFALLYSFFHLILLKNELNVENYFWIKGMCMNLMGMCVCFGFGYLFGNIIFCFLSLFYELLLHL